MTYLPKPVAQHPLDRLAADRTALDAAYRALVTKAPADRTDTPATDDTDTDAPLWWDYDVDCAGRACGECLACTEPKVGA